MASNEVPDRTGQVRRLLDELRDGLPAAAAWQHSPAADPPPTIARLYDAWEELIRLDSYAASGFLAANMRDAWALIRPKSKPRLVQPPAVAEAAGLLAAGLAEWEQGATAESVGELFDLGEAAIARKVDDAFGS